MNEKIMKIAFKESKKANKINEIPVGAVIIKNEKIISKGYNMKEKYNDPTMHAEIIAIRKACKKLKDWRLNDCTLFVTMEPCEMCLNVILECRIKNIVCGIKNKKNNKINDLIKKDKINVVYGVYSKEIIEELNAFFQKIREK
jgi:tRNA(adenine34) deaminase